MTKTSGADKSARTRSAWLFATWFGCGYSPFAPGTAGSLGAIAIAWILWLAGVGYLQFVFLGLSLLFLYPGIRAASVVAVESGRKDPQLVVVDEVLGQWLTLAGAVRYSWETFLLAFLLFRFFDIWKPPPVRQMERLPGGTGIVLDDMMAGVYGALVLFLIGWFNR